MKKYVFIAGLLLFSVTVFSQKRMGIFMGLNNSSISEGVLGQISITDKMGFHLGGFYEFDLNENIMFRPKLVYSQQGNRDGNINSIEHINYKSSYLNIPLNFKFFKTTYVLVGPQIGILISSKHYPPLANGSFGSYSPYTKGETFDFGMNLGFGQRIKDFFLELNFYQGLTKAIDKPNYNGKLVKGTNTLIQLSIGYYIF